MNNPNTLRVKSRSASGEVFYEGYDTASICENGHLITRNVETHPEHSETFCSKCGAKTVTACGHCGQKIRGHLHGTMPSMHDEPIAKFCYNCGGSYLWTEAALKAATELIAESDAFDNEEKERLTQSLRDVVQDTSRTQVAIMRLQKYLPKAGKQFADAFRSIVVDIASEAAKKALWP